MALHAIEQNVWWIIVINNVGISKFASTRFVVNAYILHVFGHGFTKHNYPQNNDPVLVQL